MVEIILTQDVEKLGKTGELVKVKDGFARNFLIPQKKAYLATPQNIRRIEQQQKKLKYQYEQEKKAARQLADKLSKVSCTVSVEVNEQEKLYGSVSESDIVKALETEGFEIERKNIILEQSIEELGIFDVGIKLHPEVTTKIRLWVTKK